MKHGKKYQEVLKKIDPSALYPLDQAAELARETSYTKFDATVEISLNLNVKAKHSIRDTLVLPHSFAGEKKILVFAKGEKAEEARQAGATFIGDAELIQKIQGGWVDFDVAVATPDMMKDVGKLGPVLGRRGLMPNPKTQTVTFDIKGAIAELKKGRVEFRADKTGVIHMAIGKVSMNKEQLTENARVLIQEVTRKRPPDVKGEFIKSIAMSSTMGPGIQVDSREKL